MPIDYKYKATDRLSDLIADNFMLLMVMSRFGLSLGFGEKNVKEVCEAQGVDWPTFLAVANFISNDQSSYYTDSELPPLSLVSLMQYLKNAHDFFLDFNLPRIRSKIIEAIDCSGSDKVARLILNFFDELVKEVESHMTYENTMVFSYVEKLLQGESNSKYNITKFACYHSMIEERLRELKNIIIKYYPERGDNNLLNDVLFDIFNCEQDLASHRKVEDCLFVPAVMNRERSLKS